VPVLDVAGPHERREREGLTGENGLGREEQATLGHAVGDGMVDACYKVIARITGISPKLERYAVKNITGGTDALGEVSCLISDNGMTVTGQGAHTDTVHASALAFVNALNKLQYRKAHYREGEVEGP